MSWGGIGEGKDPIPNHTNNSDVCFKPRWRGGHLVDIVIAQIVYMATEYDMLTINQVKQMIHYPYLVLRASRIGGTYLSKSMVRLARSDCTSRESNQEDTGGFQPRSAGFTNKIPALHAQREITGHKYHSGRNCANVALKVR